MNMRADAAVNPEPNRSHRRLDPKRLVAKFGALLGLLLLSALLAFSSEHFLTVDNLMNVLRQSAINSLVALGEMLAILTAGIDLSVGSILAFSAVIMGQAIIKWQIGALPGVLLGLGAAAFLGYLNGVLLTKLRLPHPFIATLGMLNIARGLSLIVTKSTPISGFPKSVQYLGSAFWGPVPVSVVVVLVTYGIFHVFLNNTTLGRHIYAVGGNVEAARLSGVRTDKVLRAVYLLSGLMAGMGALMLVGRVNSAYPLAGLGFETDAIAAVIIGGASFFGGSGNVWGTLIGALIMAVLRNGLNLLDVSPDFQTVAIGLVIILAVYVDVLRQRAASRGRK